MRLAGGMWLALALACGAPGGTGAGPAPDPTTPVRVVTLAPAAGNRTLSATGTLVSERQVVLRPETSGLVTGVSFSHGDRVSSGQVLVRLSDAEPRAAVAEAEARVALADAQLERTTRLFERENASRADLDRARAEAELARAQRDRAREALRRTVIRAPFAGTTGLRLVVAGDLVDPGRAVTTLVDPTALAVDVPLAERDLSGVAPGMGATVTVDAVPGRTFAGSVVFVAPAIDLATRTFGVRVSVADPDGELRPGSTARVELAGAETPALRVPTQAVLATARGSAVYVIGADDKAELRPVVTADRDLDSLRVVEGLAEGDRVVVDGLIRLRPGAAVRVLGATK